MVVCAGKMEAFDFALPIGVGLVESAMNLTRAVLFDRPDKILFIGTAGSYGNHKPFDIVHSTVACNVEVSYLDKKSYTPIDNVIDVSYETSEHKMVNSSNYITTDKEAAGKFMQLGIELENMEFYSVLSVAKEYGIPVMGVLIVTNYCHHAAHEEFLSNHPEAMKRLSDYIQQNPFTKAFLS
jgi:nucleoside phosphorylase